jgi:RNA polymerase sigma-70 factor (ECF subfamily)
VNEKVVELIINQDQEGLRLLKQHYSGLMNYIVGNILENPQDIEDCINDIVIKIWRSIDSYSKEKSKFTTWLTVIARNTALNYLRKQRIPHEELKDNLIDSSSPEAIVIRKESLEELKEAIGRLTSKEQHLFYRKYYYMQRTAQIAAELGMTERSVERKLYRLRKKIQNELGGDFK